MPIDIDLSVEDVVKRFGSFTAVERVSFEVSKGSFFSILGPSGCGKTTLLRMIAGFTEPSQGVIKIRNRNMAEIPPNRRPVNLIFQHLALFPMMTVGENIAFGLRRRRAGKAEISQKVPDVLYRVGLPGFENKKIDQLSGGQKQRVAIARCLVLEPTVLLLDEPLGALDLKLREQMKVVPTWACRVFSSTFIYITHDQSEALVMSDSVAVMNQGRFEQLDSPQNLYSHPKTAFIAQFVGDNNSWRGRIIGIENGFAVIETIDGHRFNTRITKDLDPNTEVHLFLRPEAVVIQPDPSLSDLNRFSVVVKAILFDGANSRLLVSPTKSKKELLIALPQTRQYDHIRQDDVLEIGWNPESGICFKRSEDS